MANRCSIDIWIPLDKVPDEKERKDLNALYEAEKKWDEAVKENDDLRKGVNRDAFLASQPGVPFERTENKYNFFDEEVIKGIAKDGDLKPCSEQWSKPTIHASFEEIAGRIWVHPVSFGRNSKPLFDELDGITIHLPKPTDKIKALGYPSIIHLPKSWDFKDRFPWWAEVGFAGSEKICDQEFLDVHKDETNACFNDKVYETMEFGKEPWPMPYLVWRYPVIKILENLEFVIQVYENFPIQGLTWQWDWVWKELTQLKEIYRWFRTIRQTIPEAIAELDWSEIAWNCMSYESIRVNNEPNHIMSSILTMKKDAQKFNNDKLTLEKFKKKYASHLRRNRKDCRGYIQIIKRDPFDYSDWIK